MKAVVPIGVLALAIAACAPLPQRAGIPTEWVASPNFGERRPNFVVLHHTSDDSVGEALRSLTNPLREVSAHYLVGRDGVIYQLVDERARAWHAGESYWGGQTDLNSSSIGIELDNNGAEPFPEAQIGSLIALLDDIRRRWNIPAANFLGHGDVAPGRKTDPSELFPWRRLAQRGFGLWCEEAVATAPVGDDATALQALGYDVSDFGAAAAAFKRHFAPGSADATLRDSDRARLACLLELRRNSRARR